MEAGVFGILVFLLVIGGAVLWIYALVSAIRTPDGTFRAGNQLIWVLVILLANVVGAILYLLVGRPASR